MFQQDAGSKTYRSSPPSGFVPLLQMSYTARPTTGATRQPRNSLALGAEQPRWPGPLGFRVGPFSRKPLEATSMFQSRGPRMRSPLTDPAFQSDRARRGYMVYCSRRRNGMTALGTLSSPSLAPCGTDLRCTVPTPDRLLFCVSVLRSDRAPAHD